MTSVGEPRAPRERKEPRPDEMSLGVENDPAYRSRDEKVSEERLPEINAWSRKKLALPGGIPEKTVKGSLHWENPLEDKTSKPLLEVIKLAQRVDPTTHERRRRVEGMNTGRHSPVCSVHNGTLYFRDRVYIPRHLRLRREILQLYHGDKLAGHFGMARTRKLLQR
jgi:hypothetical protein